MNNENTQKPTQVAPSDNAYFMDYAFSHGFGELHVKVDKKTGMKAIIAIHSTKRGPALGGCRFIEYPNSEAAVQDAMRLAIGMSAKAALANLPIGGGKAVIIKPSTPFDRNNVLNLFGEFVNSLDGRYITALDSGTQLDDMDTIALTTPYVASRSSHGDPSPSTALGVFRGIQAAVNFKLKRNDLKGLHIAIQGLGHVGYTLASLLHQAGAKLTVADVNQTSVLRAEEAFSANVVNPADILKLNCDVLAPCALGGVLNDLTISELQTSIVAGAANNQLHHSRHGQLLHDKGILYATDYVINAGGLIFAACKYLKTSEGDMAGQIDYIGHRLLEIFERSTNENKPTSIICDTMAQELIA
jgi:leucine dehydrogenase